MKLRQCLVALFIPFLLQVPAGALQGPAGQPPAAPLDNGTVGLWQPPRAPGSIGDPTGGGECITSLPRRPPRNGPTGPGGQQQPDYNYPGGFTVTGIRGDTFGNVRGSATNGTATRPLAYAPVPGTWEPSDFASRDHPFRLGQHAYYMRNGVLHERIGHGPWIRRGRHTTTDPDTRDILVGEV